MRRRLYQGAARFPYHRGMRVSLFVPCYVDRLSPEVAQATLEVLERLGCGVDYDPDQTCCGQPFWNLGAAWEAEALAARHLSRFVRADAVVCPSGSCVSMVRHQYGKMDAGSSEEAVRIREKTYELGEFIVRILGKKDVGAVFPHRVALLSSCHGLRELGLGRPSESGGPSGMGPDGTTDPPAMGRPLTPAAVPNMPRCTACSPATLRC